MKYLLLACSLLLLAGCSDIPTDYSHCHKISEDYPWAELREDGHTTEYVNDIWRVDGEPIGYARTEDSAFIACGDYAIIVMMRSYDG